MPRLKKMYYVASTDFDSDDEDNYPGNDRGSSKYNSNSSSNNNNESPPLKSQLSHVHEFGEFEDNYGWIQCQSKSYPDRMYYHNTRSGCNTWYRPISRYINIPFVSIRRANFTDDILESANDLELMSVSDDEKDSNVSERVSARDNNRSLSDVPDIIARYYYNPQMNLTPSTDDSRSSIDEYTSEYYMKKEQMDMKDENNENDDSDSKAMSSPLYATNFLETEFFEVEEGVVNTEGTNRIFHSLLKENSSNVPSFRSNRVVYGIPRLKKIDLKSQLIKPKRTCVTKSREAPGPRKIISEMYGVRTISYDLPDPGQADQTFTAVGVKTKTLSASDSDSDASVPSSRRAKTMRFEFERDIVKNLHQPLLSNSSSSSSNRASSSSSSSSGSNSSCSSCSCSSCSMKA